MKNKEEKDDCVKCGDSTPYGKAEHIDNRYHYVDGAGQLCKGCWDDIYTSNNEN